MDEETQTPPIYESDFFRKYTGIGYYKLLCLQSEFLNQYHNCQTLMERKKKLEKMIKTSKDPLLINHFKRRFRYRKSCFYQKIIYEILNEKPLKEMTELEKKIMDVTKEILFIYSKKQEEKEYLNRLLDDYSAAIDRAQDEWESFAEDYR